jgi:hypothetical protein
VHDRGEVQVVVRVDAADDLLVDAWDAEHRWLLTSRLDRVGTALVRRRRTRQ